MKCPHQRVIDKHSEEGKALLLGLEWALRDDYQTRVSLKNGMNKPYLLLHEFTFGIEMQYISELRARKLLQLTTESEDEV
jgi:hypothetical protein